MTRAPRTSWVSLGFTIFELLVVIAIISLLTAILTAAMGNARHQARAIVCQANLRQLAFGWHAYLDESEGRFPRSKMNMDFNYGGQQGGGSRYYGAHPLRPIPKPLNAALGLNPVVGRFHPTGDRESDTTGVEVFRCPADRGSRQSRPTNFWYYGTSYRANYILIGQDQVHIDPSGPCAETVFTPLNERLPSLTVADIVNASRLILMGDSGWVPAWQTNTLDPIDWHRRPDMHNVAFLDGHVDFLRVRKGIHTCVDYTTIPLLLLERAACGCQEEGQWP